MAYARTLVFNHGQDLDYAEMGTSQLLFKEIDYFKPYRIISGSHHLVQMSKSKPNDSLLQLESVNLVTPMGSTVPQTLFEDLKVHLPNLKFVQIVYGMTEFEVVTNSYNVNTLGIVLPGCQIKIVDLDSDEICGPKQVLIYNIFNIRKLVKVIFLFSRLAK